MFGVPISLTFPVMNYIDVLALYSPTTPRTSPLYGAEVKGAASGMESSRMFAG